MTDLVDALAAHVESGDVPGLVAMVGIADDVEVVVLGDQVLGGAPMRADSLFRIASAGKPITAAAVLALACDGVIALDDPVDELLPELAALSVLRHPTAPLSDTVPMDRSITTADLLRSTSGLGLPADPSAPIGAELVEHHQQGPPRPHAFPAPDQWIAALSEVPLAHQPGEGFTYNTSFDVLGVLVERASGQPFGSYAAERVLRPLGMDDTGFAVPPGGADRMTGLHARLGHGHLEVVDEADGAWAHQPAFTSGAGGWLSTASDLVVFHRALLDGGAGVLSPSLVAAMTSDQLTPEIRATNPTFLNGQSWGFGGGVDIGVNAPWEVPGRYGWVGGTGTSAHHVPADGSIAVLLTQVELRGPTDAAVLETFWSSAARHLGHPRSHGRTSARPVI